jgi:hypothetical protein
MPDQQLRIRGMGKRLIIIGAAFAVAAGLSAGTARAQEATLVCTNAGNSYKVGEFACIAACHGARRLARCDIVVESATWTYVSDVCPSAMFVPGPPAETSQIPVRAAMTPLPGPLKISEMAPNAPARLVNLSAATSQRLAQR